MWLEIVAIVFMVLVLAYNFIGRFFVNPYKLYLVIGKKGSGKSTLITKKAYQLTKKKCHVYLNASINLPKEQMEYVHYIGALDLWKLPKTDETRYVLLDESGLDFDCRDWATFPKEMKEFFVYQRKKHLQVWLFSQSLDVDKTIRDKADRILLVKCENGWLSIGHWINRHIAITKATDYGGSQITDEYKPMFPLNPKAWIFTICPYWGKYFDTNLTVFTRSETERKKR